MTEGQTVNALPPVFPVRPETVSRRDAVSALSALCAEHARSASVRRVEDAIPDWRVAHHRLVNQRTDFFQIHGVRFNETERRLMLEQRETAIVLLLVVETPGAGRKLLLSLRNEPGLIGGTNLSATVQSTPSNFMRRHGGAATPFIEYADNAAARGKVLSDGHQYDWGEYYLSKTKRFLILQVQGPLELPDGLLAVDAALAPELLMSDHLVTNDLRACLASYLAKERSGEISAGPHEAAPGDGRAGALARPRPVSLQQIKANGGANAYQDDTGVGVAFFETCSPSREVVQWRQPLLVVDRPMELALPVRRVNGVDEFAIVQATQVGLGGRSVWFPAPMGWDGCAGNHAGDRRVATSAEGGRFWKYEISLSIAPARQDLAHQDGGRAVTWVTLPQLSRLAMTPRATSLELRLLWSVASADA